MQFPDSHRLGQAHLRGVPFPLGCDLVGTVLSLNPQLPLNLSDFDRPSLLTITDSKPLSQEQVYTLSMPLIVSFRITVMSLPYFKAAFIEKNAECLGKRIDCIANYIQYNYIFCSLIELLPGPSLFTR